MANTPPDFVLNENVAEFTEKHRNYPCINYIVSLTPLHMTVSFLRKIWQRESGTMKVRLYSAHPPALLLMWEHTQVSHSSSDTRDNAPFFCSISPERNPEKSSVGMSAEASYHAKQGNFSKCDASRSNRFEYTKCPPKNLLPPLMMFNLLI